MQDNFTASPFGNFATPGDWSLGVPTGSEDAEINDNAIVTSDAGEVVNSIGTGSSDVLNINGNSNLEVKDGTGPNQNAGTISVFQAKLSLVDSATFENTGTIKLTGDNSADAALFEINANEAVMVTLSGGGTVVMSIGGGPNANEIYGQDSHVAANFINLDDTISGDGTIGGDLAFVNDGTVETNNGTSPSGGTLAIPGSAGYDIADVIAGSFTNNNIVRADNGGTLIFGVDGFTGSIDNEATIILDATTVSASPNTKLEIAGNMTITATGNGQINLGGADAQTGDEIVSDGKASTLTLVNQTIKGAGVIGDLDLTLDNVSGTIDADIPESTLALGGLLAGAPEISNGGTLEATNGGYLEDLFAPVDNTGTITANGGGVAFGQAVSGSGAIDIGAGGFAEFVSTVAGNVTFTGSNATLIVGHAGIGGQILGAAVSDSIDAGFISFAASEHAVWQQTSSSGGTLSLYENGVDLASFNLAGQFNSLDFNVNAGIGVGTNITIQNTPAYPANGSNNDEWILSDGQWAASADPGSHPAGYNVASIGDWTGSGTDGILWFDPSTGDTDEWQLSNTQWAASVDLGSHPGNYQISGTGDFFGNGRDDVLWTNTSGGNVQTDIWELNSSGQWMASVSPGSHPAGYTVASTGDWTGNGTDGILWYNASTGDTDEWQLNNGQWSASVDLGSHPGSGWTIAGVGDFFDNGRDDVLWTNSSGGSVQTDIWQLSANGQWMASVSPGSHPAGYSVVGIGDFTGTGTSDILWYNASTGDTDEWLINNGQWAGSIDLGTHPGNFQIAGVGDFNGAGNAGILWHG
jgi:hypothetical protein